MKLDMSNSGSKKHKVFTMSAPKFRPRQMAAPSSRRNFGKVAEVSWLPARTEADRSQIDAARLQHVLAFRISLRLQETGHSIRSYAELTGIGYDRMTKMLRGEALMRLEDVTDAEHYLGQIFQAELPSEDPNEHRANSDHERAPFDSRA